LFWSQLHISPKLSPPPCARAKQRKTHTHTQPVQTTVKHRNKQNAALIHLVWRSNNRTKG
jgi:hypothetical protein